jgi:hypothetical protein
MNSARKRLAQQITRERTKTLIPQERNNSLLDEICELPVNRTSETKDCRFLAITKSLILTKIRRDCIHIADHGLTRTPKEL